jgi:hypothetical protein
MFHVMYFWNVFFILYINYIKGFYRGISHLHTLYFDQINAVDCFLFFPSSLVPIFEQLSVGFLRPQLYRDKMYFDIIHFIILFSFSSTVPPNNPTIKIMLYICTYIYAMSRFYIWENTCSLCPFLLNMIISSSAHFPANDTDSFFFMT